MTRDIENFFGTCSFICQGTLTSRQQNGLVGLKNQAICYYQSKEKTIHSIQLSTLPKRTSSEITSLSLYFSLMLNVKQESCEQSRKVLIR